MLAILMPWRHHPWPPGRHLPSICSLPTSRLFNLHSLRKSIVIEVSWPIQEFHILYQKWLCYTSFWMYLCFAVCFREGEFAFYPDTSYRFFGAAAQTRAQRLLRYILLPRSPGASSAEPPLVFTHMATFALHCEPSILPRIVSLAESCLGGLDELLISLIFPADSKCSV